MKITSMFFFIALNVALMEEIPKKDYFYYDSDIIVDSELGYVEKPGGIIIVGKEGRSKIVAISKKEIAICKKGKAYITVIYTLQDGKQREEEIPISLKKYLELWKELKLYNIFDLTTKDWRITVQENKNKDNVEEIILKDYKSIESLREGASTYQFFFRIGDRKHEIQIYDIENLRDGRYLHLKSSIMRFFGWIN